MLIRIDSEIIKGFNNVNINENGLDMEKEGLKGPSSTWTYLINDNPDQFSHMAFLVKATSTVIKGTLFSFKSIYRLLIKKK